MLGVFKSVPKAPLKPAAPKKAKIDWKHLADCTTEKAFKALMPPVAGARLQPYPAKKAFQAYYPGAIPGSRSRTCGFAFSKEAVLKHVVKWAWEEHRKATGAVCPFTF